MKYECTEELFNKAVEAHQMIVIRDEGLSRHLRFKKPETTDMYFDLITWRGHLCYTGDMGTYVFTRVDDMFKFFRGDRINPGYWEEKCIASQTRMRGNGIKAFDVDTFNDTVREYIKNYWELDVVPEDLQAELDREVLCHHENEYEAYQAAHNFSFKEYNFYDCEGLCGWIYTYHFIWCLRALVWGINQYDKSKED